MLYCKMSRIWKHFRKSPIFYVPYKVSISLAILNRPFPRAVLKRIFKSKSRRHSYTLFCKFVTPCQFDSGSALSTLSRLRVSFKNRPRCNHLTSSSSFLSPPPRRCLNSLYYREKFSLLPLNSTFYTFKSSDRDCGN